MSETIKGGSWHALKGRRWSGRGDPVRHPGGFRVLPSMPDRAGLHALPSMPLHVERSADGLADGGSWPDSRACPCGSVGNRLHALPLMPARAGLHGLALGGAIHQVAKGSWLPVTGLHGLALDARPGRAPSPCPRWNDPPGSQGSAGNRAPWPCLIPAARYGLSQGRMIARVFWLISGSRPRRAWVSAIRGRVMGPPGKPCVPTFWHFVPKFWGQINSASSCFHWVFSDCPHVPMSPRVLRLKMEKTKRRGNIRV